jgi:SAM-dependent methyltransferase
MKTLLSPPAWKVPFKFTAALLLATATLFSVVPARAQSPTTPQRPPDVPYVPTPQQVVDKMLDMAKVNKDDVVYDLGSGDGRIVTTAAQQFGARGVGIDINPVRIAEAKENAKRAGVTDKVDLRVGDIFETNFSEASIVTLYLLPNINRKLRPQLWQQLKVGTRVVSHAFDMGDEWPPERVERVEHRTIYYWTIKEEHKQAMK